MADIELRLAGVQDIGLISSLAARIWPVCYSNIISAGQIDYMLGMMYSDVSLRRQMTEEGCRFTLAYSGDIPVGFSSTSEKEAGLFRLHKLYVDTSLHRKGVGSILLNDVLEYASEHGGDQLELNVNKSNPAVRFYLARGFEVWREEVLDIGNGYVMDDFVMRRNIRA
ncbi:MAG: hypothetical protein RL220_1617 [Bacteroidota bacterium]